MKRIFLTSIAALLLATGTAHAKSVKKSILPPPEFDHLYEGRITIIHDDEASLPCRPRSLSIRLGCTFLEDDKDHPPEKTCFVWLAPRGQIEKAGYTENIIFRRQIALCNGWKRYRRLRYELEWEKEVDKELRKIE
jgi:hypothetical protein